jgi:hypothetical protein
MIRANEVASLIPRRLLEDVKRFQSDPQEAYTAVRQAIRVLRKVQANFDKSSANR